MYIAEPRFTATYEKIALGLAQYLHDAIKANASRNGA
jgi:MerR family transcriptional regulator, thiopeptide resistance regulator